MGQKKTRRTFSPEFKAKVGLEAVRGVKTINEIAQEFGVHLATARTRTGTARNATARAKARTTVARPRTRSASRAAATPKPAASALPRRARSRRIEQLAPFSQQDPRRLRWRGSCRSYTGGAGLRAVAGRRGCSLLGRRQSTSPRRRAQTGALGVLLGLRDASRRRKAGSHQRADGSRIQSGTTTGLFRGPGSPDETVVRDNISRKLRRMGGPILNDAPHRESASGAGEQSRTLRSHWPNIDLRTWLRWSRPEHRWS